MREYITVWMCPNDECGNYYAARSSEQTDLTKVFNYANNPKVGVVPTFPRSQCPDCGQQRVRCTARVLGGMNDNAGDRI